MEIMSYFARPIECTGKVYRLGALLTDGKSFWYPVTANQEEMWNLARNKNRELIKSL